MDFSNRSMQSPAEATGTRVNAATATGNGKRHKSDKGKWGRIGVMAIIVAVVVLIVALILLVASSNTKSEDSYIDTSKLQAVFLNTGQVYFGNIKALNSKYFVLQNIYYLQTTNSGSSSSSSSSNANTNVTLVKLGCELHQPYDQMVINSDQVTFWENLQSSGQVAQAVATFQKDNPNGQKCTDQSNSASSSSVNSTQNSTQNNGSTSSTPATGSSKP